MASWQNGKLTKWQINKMASWQNGKLTKCKVDKVADLQKCQVDKILVESLILMKWQVDKVAFDKMTKKCIFQVKNLKKRGVKKPKVFTLHKDLPIKGGWTITPLTTLLIDVINLTNNNCFHLDYIGPAISTCLSCLFVRLVCISTHPCFLLVFMCLCHFLSVCPYVHWLFILSVCFSMFLCLSMYFYVFPCIFMSFHVCLSFHVFLCLSTYLSVFPCICLSFYVSVCLSM